MVVGDDTETTPKSSASTATSGDHHNHPTSQQAAATSTSTSTGVAASPSPRPAPPSGFTAINLGPEEEEQEFVFDDGDHGVIGAWWWCCERCDIARNRWRTILAALFLFALGVIFAVRLAQYARYGWMAESIAFVRSCIHMCPTTCTRFDDATGRSGMVLLRGRYQSRHCLRGRVVSMRYPRQYVTATRAPSRRCHIMVTHGIHTTIATHTHTGYQTYVLIRALRSDPGWDISMVPSYDDD